MDEPVALDLPIFTNRNGNVINYKGENYYRACGAFVFRDDVGITGCVKRVNHPGQVHEDFDGHLRSDIEDGYEMDAGIKQDGFAEEAHDKDNKTCTCSTVTISFTATCKDQEESERVLEYFSRSATQMAQDQIPVSINLYNLGEDDG